MENISIEKYLPLIDQAVAHFWATRKSQSIGQKKADQGNRSSVTGGKQLDGFVSLMREVSVDIGIPENCIFTKGSILPGFFRPSKDWDFIIISPKSQLLAAVELKSQVGSFGNNFNNRTEEAIGSAVDLWTAFREGGFSQSKAPWLGFALLLEKTEKSNRPVKIKEPHFKARGEFQNTSYLERYVLLCKKLMQERHYSFASLITTSENGGFELPDEAVSIHEFLYSFIGYIKGQRMAFEK